MEAEGHRRILRTTRWSLVRRAVSGGPALDKWVSSCWFPLYTWARHKGWSHEDSADAVQDFLAKICRKELLSKVDPARGKLRSWLLTSFGNHLSSAHAARRRLKRGGCNRFLNIDWALVEKEHAANFSTGMDPEKAYSRAWVVSLMDTALQRLSEHYSNTGRGVLFETIVSVLEEPPADTTYERMAEDLSMSAQALRQAAVRLRQRYRLHLLELAGERLGITDEALLNQELRELFSG